MTEQRMYNLSFMAMSPITTTTEPKWWEFWIKPTSITVDKWVRYSTIITPQESKLLCDTPISSPLWDMVLRFVSNRAHPVRVSMIQIEQIGTSGTNEYVGESH